MQGARFILTATTANFADVADSTSATIGPVKMAGGVAIAKSLYVGAAIVATGDITAFSDIRLKKNISTISNAVGIVKNMRGVRFENILTGEKSVGLIAQEVAQILPELVRENKSNDDTILSVAYGNVVGVLVECIKELHARIEVLEKLAHPIP